MNEVYFPALFPGFPLPEELVEALGRLAVVHAELDRETRTIRLDAQAEQYLAEKQLQALCRDIEKEYGLRGGRIVSGNPEPQKLGGAEAYR